MKNISWLCFMLSLILSFQLTGQVLDSLTDSRDGKIYNTVTIGTQTWMSENLAFNSGYGCWAYQDNTENIAIYGYLYMYESAKSVCPAGWHLPSDMEWNTLVKYLGGNKMAGTKLMECGFSPTSGGFRNGFGMYSGLSTHGMWWSSTWSSSMNAWYRLYTFQSNKFEQRNLGKFSGFSVRCVKD
jgi:uncharacterized protein (TIGR02145 family)